MMVYGIYALANIIRMAKIERNIKKNHKNKEIIISIFPDINW